MGAPREFRADKIYWTIGEVSEEIGENPSTIRFWLSSFGVDVKRSAKKENREFRQSDKDFLVEVKRLVRDEGHTIDGTRKKLIANKFLKG